MGQKSDLNLCADNIHFNLNDNCALQFMDVRSNSVYEQYRIIDISNSRIPSTSLLVEKSKEHCGPVQFIV